MHSRHWILATTLLMPAALSAAEQPLPDVVASHVQKLGSAKFSERDRAARELARIGQPAIKPLQLALASTDVEVRQRAQTLILAIEARLLNEALIRPPTISLSYHRKPLDEALADLAKKTRLPFVLDPLCKKDAKGPITLETGEVPFWTGVEKFLEAAGLVENPIPFSASYEAASEQQTYLRPQSANTIRLIACQSIPAAATNTIVRVKALPNDFPNNHPTNGSNEINLTLDVTPASSLDWRGLVGIDIRRALDDRGRVVAQSYISGSSVAIEPTHWKINRNVINKKRFPVARPVQLNGWEVDPYVLEDQIPRNPRHYWVTLLGHDSPSKMLIEVEGVITGRVLSPRVPVLTIDDLLTVDTKVPIRNGGYAVRISGRRIDQNGYPQLTLDLISPPQDQVEAIPANGGVEPGLDFLDSAGEKVGIRQFNKSDRSIEGQYNRTHYYLVFAPLSKKGGGIVKLAVTERRSVMVEVPFALKNVPLH